MSRLVFLHLRFHTYKMGWTDSAVRRFVRDADDLLPELIELTRCDCTTRNERKAATLARRMDELEARIAELQASEELKSIRPDLDGNQVMAHLGLTPGRDVGQALDFLLELRLEEGPLGEEEAYRRLDAWWAERQAGLPGLDAVLAAPHHEGGGHEGHGLAPERAGLVVLHGRLEHGVDPEVGPGERREHLGDGAGVHPLVAHDARDDRSA